MNVLVLEPYYGGSHRVFLDGLVRHSAHTLHPITMPARFWKWRMHGGAVTLANKTFQLLEEGFKPDLIFATDMVNLPAFLALVRHRLSQVPVVLYFHENQLTYPLPEGVGRDYTYAYINYLSAMAADRVLFNSRFHFEQFMEALPVMLRRFPDFTHLQNVQIIRQKSQVLYPGIDLQAHDQYAHVRRKKPWGPGMDPPTILWNHRWEYDKNPAAFFRVMNRLDDAGFRFNLILAGEHFEEQPPEFEYALRRYPNRILHYGYAEDFAEYSTLLHQADIVVSTAIHEFFGIAILEAIYCGCHPLLPNRLTYPELIPERLHRPLLHAPILYEDEEHLFAILKRLLSGEERPLPQATLRDIPRPYNWRTHTRTYDRLFESMLPTPVPSPAS